MDLGINVQRVTMVVMKVLKTGTINCSPWLSHNNKRQINFSIVYGYI